MDMKRLPLPTGMHAVITKYGMNQQDALENSITLEEQPPPLLSELEEGDIVVAVKACEVVWTDTVMMTGQYQHQAKATSTLFSTPAQPFTLVVAQLPYSPGMTYSGTVVWLGGEAEKVGIRLGQSVAVAGNTGPRSLGRHQRWGGCASYAVCPVEAVRIVPQALHFWSPADRISFTMLLHRNGHLPSKHALPMAMIQRDF